MRHALVLIPALLVGCSKPAPAPAPATTAAAPAPDTPPETPPDTSPETPDPAPPEPAGPDLEGFEVIASNDGTYSIAFRQSPDPLPLNEMFDLEVWVLDSTGSPVAPAILDVDARMPHHHHGMNLIPGIEPLGEGRFEVTEMRFHMPGYWEIYFDVTLDGVTERAQTSTVLD